MTTVREPYYWNQHIQIIKGRTIWAISKIRGSKQLTNLSVHVGIDNERVENRAVKEKSPGNLTYNTDRTKELLKHLLNSNELKQVIAAIHEASKSELEEQGWYAV